MMIELRQALIPYQDLTHIALSLSLSQVAVKDQQSFFTNIFRNFQQDR